MILTPLLLVFVLNRLNLAPNLFPYQFVFYIFVAFGCVIVLPLFAALEESLHIAVCIQQGKSNLIEGIFIDYALIKGKYRIFVKKTAATFYGSFTTLERIQMHGAPSALILVFMSILFILILFLVHIPISYLVLLGLFLFIPPIVGLLPNKSYENDGYFIIKYARQLRLSAPQTIQQVLYGMFLALRYGFLGLRGVKKYNTKLLRASDFVKSGDYKNALPILEAELKKDPSDPEICNNIAWCYAELGINLDRAMELVKKAIEIEPVEALYHDTLGWCYNKNGELDNAKDQIDEAIKLEPNNNSFQEHLKRIEAAQR